VYSGEGRAEGGGEESRGEGRDGWQLWWAEQGGERGKCGGPGERRRRNDGERRGRRLRRRWREEGKRVGRPAVREGAYILVRVRRGR
jgi:hypothetical protein